MDTIDVVIVGAGIIGCSTAFELSELGLKVEVVEKYKPGAMGSGWTLAGVRQSGRHESEIPLAKYSSWGQTGIIELTWTPLYFISNGSSQDAGDFLFNATG